MILEAISGIVVILLAVCCICVLIFTIFVKNETESFKKEWEELQSANDPRNWRKVCVRIIDAIKEYRGHYVYYNTKYGPILYIIDLNKSNIIENRISFIDGHIDKEAIAEFAEKHNVDIHYLLEGGKDD